MTETCTILFAQQNVRVGDLAYNVALHKRVIQKARALKADVIVFPELSLTGYPPEDLLLRPSFISACMEALRELVADKEDIYCVVGHPQPTPKGLMNVCSVLYQGNIIGQYAKADLPNYGVFDEKRYFVSGSEPCVIPIKGIPMGLVICEDIWSSQAVLKARAAGAKIILSPNASPYELDKIARRESMVKKRCLESGLPICYVNLVGGQDELIFDGSSFAMNSEGELCAKAPFCEETLFPVQLKVHEEKVDITKTEISHSDLLQQVYSALVLSLHDYVTKNKFNKVILGLSGGIDSALTLALAVDALGAENVLALALPSRYSADISLSDAQAMAENLKVRLETYSIEPTFTAFLDTLKAPFAATKTDITEENIQARIRAILLMAFSNKFGYLLLSTGNRSELAVGYCTLYGDMAGGFAPLKDIPKTMVYELAHYRNHIHPVIPKRILERAPSAELAFNQTDQDSLPPYAELDQMLLMYLNQNLSVEDIVKAGFARATVERIVALIKRNEYKRRQGSLGPRVNHRAFGRDWRYPISSGFKG